MSANKVATASAAEPATADQTDMLDQSLLLSLVGYNCRRAYIAIEPHFVKKMAKYDLRPAEFSILSILRANPDISPKHLARAIYVSPPNLAPLLDRLEKRKLLVRQPNPLDKRSQTLALTADGLRLCAKAEKTAVELETEATSALSDAERRTLTTLLQKVFLTE